MARRPNGGRIAEAEFLQHGTMSAFARVWSRLPCAGLLGTDSQARKARRRGCGGGWGRPPRVSPTACADPPTGPAPPVRPAGRSGRAYHALPMTVQATAAQPVRSWQRCCAACRRRLRFERAALRMGSRRTGAMARQQLSAAVATATYKLSICHRLMHATSPPRPPATGLLPA